MDQLVRLATSIRVGDPKDPATEMGPLTSAVHRDRVLSYVELVDKEGGTVISGGRTPSDAALAGGYYVEPMIVDAASGSRAAQEEVFGPFKVVLTFRTDEEAIAIANGVEFGLGGGLWINIDAQLPAYYPRS